MGSFQRTSFGPALLLLLDVAKPFTHFEGNRDCLAYLAGQAIVSVQHTQLMCSICLLTRPQHRPGPGALASKTFSLCHFACASACMSSSCSRRAVVLCAQRVFRSSAQSFIPESAVAKQTRYTPSGLTPACLHPPFRAEEWLNPVPRVMSEFFLDITVNSQFYVPFETDH